MMQIPYFEHGQLQCVRAVPRHLIRFQIACENVTVYYCRRTARREGTSWVRGGLKCWRQDWKG